MTALGRVVHEGRTVRGPFALALLIGSATAAVAVALTATSAWLISRASQQPPVLYLMVAIVAVRAFGIARGVLRYLERLTAHDAAFRVLADLRVHAYQRLERLAPAGLDAYRSGDLLARLVGDIDGLADLWLRVLLPYGSAVIVGGLTVLFVGWLVPAAGLVLALTLVAAAVVAPLVAIRVARHADGRISPLRGRWAGEALDAVRGAPEIVVAGATERRLDALAATDAAVRDAEAGAAAGTGAGAWVTGLASGLAVWCALVAGVQAVADGRSGGVLLAVVVLTPMAAHEVVAGLASGAQRLPGLTAAATRLADVLDRPDPTVEPAHPGTLPQGPLGLRIWGLAAGYAPDAAVLRDVDLEVAPGGLALVTGPSGSGKSTLAAVLVGFLAPTAGRIELVGADRSIAFDDLAGDDIRAAVGLCAQDVHVFDTSIAENVRFARPEADDGAIRRALRQAGLANFVDALPNGIATMVGEHGARLSGGQRQRLGLARVLLADRRIVVFDEPTEHVDELTAGQLVTDLLAASAGRTVILITHQPSVMAAVHPTAELALPG